MDRKGVHGIRIKRKERMKEKTHEQLGSKTTTTTVPRQRRQKCLLVFLNVHRIIRKRTEDTVVALHPEVFRVSYFRRERMCNDILASLIQENKK